MAFEDSADVWGAEGGTAGAEQTIVGGSDWADEDRLDCGQ